MLSRSKSTCKTVGLPYVHDRLVMYPDVNATALKQEWVQRNASGYVQ